MNRYSQLSKDRIDLSKAIPLVKPFTILLEPTSTCNFRCPWCYYGDPNLYNCMPKGRMTLENFYKIANDLKTWEGDKFKVIRIIGFGEPFLNKHTPKMVGYLKELDVSERIEITSNCSKLTPSISQELIDYELDYLRCSIYATSKEGYKNLSHTKVAINYFDQILTNLYKLRRLRGSKERPFIYIKMLDNGEEENKRFLEMYLPLADEIAIEPKHNWLLGKEGDSICPQPFKMMSIRFNGDVIMCDPDWRNNTKVGNAIQTSLKDIWGGEQVRAFWKMQLEHRRNENESCKYCTFVDNTSYVLDKL